MECVDVKTCLDAFRTHELTENMKSEIERHLNGCSFCRSSFDALVLFAGKLHGYRNTSADGMATGVLERIRDGFGILDTEFGRVWVGFCPEGITMIQIGLASDEDFIRKYVARFDRPIRSAPLPARYVRPVEKALMGQKISTTPVILDGLSSFEQNVLSHLARIPYGEVRPYAWLAKEAGNPGAVRAVGNIMARNPIPFILPCHRVVPTGGGVGEYGFGSAMKRELLTREGVPVDYLDRWKQDRVRYIGSRTTGIYCYPTCRDARRISWENQVNLHDEQDARQRGFRPCLHCRPLSA
jgi:O-6-methylguanine DNA methyltransferase